VHARRLLAFALLVALAVAGCGTVAERGPLIVPLPARTLPPGNFACGGVGYDPEPILRGDPRNDPPVWAEFGGGHRAAIVWPPGYTGVFDPDLIVLGPDGAIVAREGRSLAEGPDNPWPGLFICAGTAQVWIWEDPG
jgi:hypothetical protein